MIEVRVGNALDVPTGIIVHGVNCHGVMGSGIAREVRERFPTAYEAYRRVHESEGLVLGNICFVEVMPWKLIVNANTQLTFGPGRRQVNYEAVAQCFEKVTKLAKNVNYKNEQNLDIIFPMIGAGLGGGNWNIISTIIDETVPDEFNKILYVLSEEEKPNVKHF